MIYRKDRTKIQCEPYEYIIHEVISNAVRDIKKIRTNIDSMLRESKDKEKECLKKLDTTRNRYRREVLTSTLKRLKERRAVITNDFWERKRMIRGLENWLTEESYNEVNHKLYLGKNKKVYWISAFCGLFGQDSRKMIEGLREKLDKKLSKIEKDKLLITHLTDNKKVI